MQNLTGLFESNHHGIPGPTNATPTASSALPLSKGCWTEILAVPHNVSSCPRRSQTVRGLVSAPAGKVPDRLLLACPHSGHRATCSHPSPL